MTVALDGGQVESRGQHLLGMIVGAKSRSSSARSGLLVGLYLSVMATFPLLAIGLANT